MSDSEIKVLFTSSRKIHPQFSDISLGKYIIEPVPSEDSDNSNATNQYLLRFIDEFDEEQGRSTPSREAQLILSFVSLTLGTNIEIKSLMINSVNFGVFSQDVAASSLIGVISELPDLSQYLMKFHSLDIDLARQFIRAANVYKTSVSLIGQNNTLSFFLLTVAIECLSNKVIDDGGKCDKFIAFISNFSDGFAPLDSDEDFIGLLKEVYYNHRSGFTHGGKEIPEATNVADQLDRPYIKHLIDGKEVKSPSLKWFEKVVRNCLLNFLLSTEIGDDQPDLLKEISLEKGIIQVKAKRDIEAGQVVTEKDLDLE